MKLIEHLLRAPNHRVWACAALTLVAVVTVLVWATNMDGDSSQTAAMLGATIAVTAATSASGPRSCRPAFLSRRRRSSRR